MRILALETNVEVLKKKYLAEGEQAVFVTHRHIFAFFIHLIWQALFSFLMLLVFLFLAVQGLWGALAVTISFWVWFVFSLYCLFTAYVAWKCNFLIVTTQKVVLVHQQSLFHQQINPVPFTSISNTRVESQLFGFFHCGTLHLITRVTELGGQVTELAFPLLPKPEDVAAVIENGLVVGKKLMDTAEEQERKTIMQQPAITAGNPAPEILAEEQKKEPPKS